MISTSLLILLSRTTVSSESLTPECDYAAMENHFYPIAACTTTRNITDSNTTYYAFQFICEGQDVIQYQYDTAEYCHGAPINSINITQQLESYECDLDVCVYSNLCSYTGCYDENSTDSCQKCRENQALYSEHCFPMIAGHCMGSVGESLKYDECQNGVLTENHYAGTNCSGPDSLISSVRKGGFNASHNCLNETYYTANCVARDLPICNYAATGTHYFPIHSCDRTKTIITDSGAVEYFAFEYICMDNGDVYRREYNDSDYCQGAPVMSQKVNHLLEHYDCDLGACAWADGCSLSLSSCDNTTNECDYNMHCLPTLVDNCVGNVGGLLHYALCHPIDGNTTDMLTEYFYFGQDCEGDELWSEQWSGDDESHCGQDSYYKVQCTNAAAAASNDITYQTAECTPPPQPPQSTEPMESSTAEPQSTESMESSTAEPQSTEPMESGTRDLSLCFIVSYAVSVLLVIHY